MKRKKKQTRGSTRRAYNISVRSELREPPDLDKLARALITDLMAKARAEQEAGGGDGIALRERIRMDVDALDDDRPTSAPASSGHREQ